MSNQALGPESPSETNLPDHEPGDYGLRFQSIRVIFALLMREMTTTFGRSKLGYLWAILEPVGGIIVLTFGFSLLFKDPPIGDSFALFYATGFLPFACYTTTYAQLVSAVKANKPLLFYPAVTFIDVIMARIILVTLTQMTIFTIIFGGILALESTGAKLQIGLILLSMLSAVGVGVGVGIVNATLFEIVPSWQNIWSILNRPLFFLSCVFYAFDAMPEKMQKFLWWNPLVHVIGKMREGFYAGYEGGYISMLYVATFSLVLIVIGLINMRASNRFIINN